MIYFALFPTSVMLRCACCITFIYILMMINKMNQGTTLTPPVEIQAVFMPVDV